jgi:ubiquinone/menaquinone biosynthesis C-methylase UbiE
MTSNPPPVCDYEGSRYQRDFWDSGTRVYEDLCESAAIKRLLPSKGRLLLELGAGAGRNTPRYAGYDRIVLLDYSRTQLQQARARLGDSDRFIYVAGNIYTLPFVSALFDGATMIRTLHHMANPQSALNEVARVLENDATFLLEFANKRNLKAILRYLLRRQKWNPFSPDPVEYTALNFDFHPQAVRQWLQAVGFEILRMITVSHFRVAPLKRVVPPRLLASADSLLGRTGNLFQLSPSVFTLCRLLSPGKQKGTGFFRCPACGSNDLKDTLGGEGRALVCGGCRIRYPVRDGIFDFKEPILP